MAKAKTISPQRAAVLAETPAEPVAAAPTFYNVVLRKAYRHGKTWLRPYSPRIRVSEALLAKMQGAGAIASAQKVAT